MRTAAPLLLALAACSENPTPDAAGLKKELAGLREELDELLKVRAEMCGALDELGTQIRKLREKTEWSAPPASTFPAVLPRTTSSANEYYWVLSPMIVKGQTRSALALYRAAARGFQLDSVRIVEDDVANALR